MRGARSGTQHARIRARARQGRKRRGHRVRAPASRSSSGEARLVADELGGGLAQPGRLHRRQLAQHGRDHVQLEGLLDRAQLARV
eukprot:7387428-Prymnesium_polylepis.1